MAFEGEDEGSFGELLARYRTQSRMSREKLAACLHVHRNTVIKWEQGSLPKYRTRIEEIVRCLNLRDPQREALFKAALFPLPHLIQNFPYHRNPFFTGRDQELEQLHVQLQQKQTVAIGQIQSISGLGGIGKTQLAVEYAYRHQDEYQYVLWADAENVEALIASFAKLADLLNLPGKDAQEQALTIQAVKHWLQRQRSWLLILDNADHPDLLRDFLPSTVGGCLLITTRCADLSAYLPSLAHPLVMHIFSDEQGALFLLHRSGLLALDATLDQVETGMRQLALSSAHELGGLPLALDQAGAYLRTTGCSLATYQQLYQQRCVKLLSERRGARDDHPESVATTWDISFRNIERQNPGAADLLRLCAFLAPDAIPEGILTKGAEGFGPVLGPVVADAYLFNEAIVALRMYSLIDRDPHTQAIAIHRLVQVILRDSMCAEIRRQWMQRAVHVVETALPERIDILHWPLLECLLPHVLICVAWIEQMPLVKLTSARMLYLMGYYLHARARYAEAESFYHRALHITEQQFGKEHPETASVLEGLAKLYNVKRKDEEAESLYKRALAIRENSLGVDHPDVASTLNGLASLHSKRQRYEEAEPLYKRALAIRENSLGVDHPDVASALNNLAILYSEQKLYKEAELSFKRALKIRELVLGDEHPDVAFSLYGLARLYEKQRRFNEAELLYRQALKIRKLALGDEHFEIIYPLVGLGIIYEEQRRFNEAELLYRQALKIGQLVLGVEHPDVAEIEKKLASLGKQYWDLSIYGGGGEGEEEEEE